MDQSSSPGEDFAFALPLQWPSNPQDRLVYERMLVDFSRLFASLLQGGQGDETGQLLEFLHPIVREMRGLWPEGETMPQEIADLLGFFCDGA